MTKHSRAYLKALICSSDSSLVPLQHWGIVLEDFPNLHCEMYRWAKYCNKSSVLTWKGGVFIEWWAEKNLSWIFYKWLFLSAIREKVNPLKKRCFQDQTYLSCSEKYEFGLTDGFDRIDFPYCIIPVTATCSLLKSSRIKKSSRNMGFLHDPQTIGSAVHSQPRVQYGSLVSFFKWDLYWDVLHVL